MSSTKKSISVLGAGVVGLTTALVLQASGHDVTIIATEFPDKYDEKSQYTSPKAGAHWRSTAGSDKRLQQYDAISFKVFEKLHQTHVAQHGGIIKIPSFDVYDTKDAAQADHDPWFKDIVPDFRYMTEEQLPPNTIFGFQYQTYTFNSPLYLNWLLRTFLSLGGQTKTRHIKHVDDLFEQNSDSLVINCSGLGARVLGGVNDEAVYPTRGQTVIVNAPWVGYTISKLGSEFTYVIPRSDGHVILGGTYQEHNPSVHSTPSTSADIVAKCLRICPQLLRHPGDHLDIIAHRTGLRPTRTGGARVALEAKSNQRKVIHNYGHGGYGFQSSWGCAVAVAKLVSGAEASGIDPVLGLELEEVVNEDWLKKVIVNSVNVGEKKSKL